MAFEDVMGAIARWSASIEAAAALGAELTLKQTGQTAGPEVTSALRAVTEAAGLGDLDELAPPQRQIAIGLIHLYVHQAVEILGDPARDAGWLFTDPVILDGWGRASTMVPNMITACVPELGEVTSFLDVGAGVGLLAVAAANLWPSSTIVGVDRWEPSLERARANVAAAGLGERIELRTQDVVDVDDEGRYDLVWVPTFFLTEEVLTKALPGLVRATKPGGTIVFGIFSPPPDPLAAAVSNLRTVRGGGELVESKRGIELLEGAGVESVRYTQPPGPSPLGFVVGQRSQA